MSHAVDISYLSLFFTILLLLVPLAISYYLRLGLAKQTLISAARMALQLFLVGIFLNYIFVFNNALLNIAWLFMMVCFAVSSVISSTKLSYRYFFIPSLFAFVLANYSLLLYFNSVIVRIDYIFDAKYVIAIGGMLLGNALRGNIIGIGNFYNEIRKDEKLYFYYLASGASKKEALIPFFRKSMHSAIRPTIANMATMGIVSLPGMMTGQILGGSSPLVAIKYQIAIMIAIFVSSMLSICLSVLFTVRVCFDEYAVLRKKIFRS
jgi:putative ABC transport system permease protein